MKRWTSRKFLLSLSTQIVAILVLLWPSEHEALVEAGESITALVILLLTTLGYVSVEGRLDGQAHHASANTHGQKDP